MKTRLIIALALLPLATPAFAHRIDEYLQAILVSIEPGNVQVSMRLIPGIAVSGAVISAVDSNSDGVLSESEQLAYAKLVLHDLSLSAEGRPLALRLRSFSFPAVAEMKDGLGEIRLEFAADLPAGKTERALTIENRHQPPISVYLMNCLLPRDIPASGHSIRLTSQNRNANQSYYRIGYTQLNRGPRWRSGLISALTPFAGVPAMFRLGVRHIAEGTDHLLFLLALLLPAPLLAARNRWAEYGGLRFGLIQIVRVVTAFTVGHSLTLALGALGVVSLPSRVVEVLIAFSILISAIHAVRPPFPGREPLIACLFGLIHGLAFATTLENLGVGGWARIAGILGFNLGIESMQLVVVAAVLPSLVMLSRLPVYKGFRFAGALFAGSASLVWIAERLFDAHTSFGAMPNNVAQRGVWLAAALFAVSVVLSARAKPRPLPV